MLDSLHDLETRLNYRRENLRPPSTVMKLERLGAFHPTRISFTRTLIRRMSSEGWKIQIDSNNLDDDGFGELVYRIDTPAGALSFIAYSNPLDDRDRTDRVIAEKWDMAFTLSNGIASQADVDRLRNEVPKQEAGRMSANEIVLSRANKSVRLFHSVVNCLANGQQPDWQQLSDIGYLIRTTAVYGNGKFGLMDFGRVQLNTPFRLPFQAEMLTVYMARQFSLDLVHHVAKAQGQNQAVVLAKNLQRNIGVGNATGLGMAPYLIGHPSLIGRWIELREIGITRVRSVQRATNKDLKTYLSLLDRIIQHIQQWTTGDERQGRRVDVLLEEVEGLKAKGCEWLKTKYPWRLFSDWVFQNNSVECNELAVSIMLELYPQLINELEDFGAFAEPDEMNPGESLVQMRERIQNHYDWALEFDFEDPDSEHFFWYTSQGKEEPRLGERYNEPGGELEMRIGIAREVRRLKNTIDELPEAEQQLSIAEFLHHNPQHRFIVSRIQSLERFPYAEIQDNLIGVDCLPINLLRCKLAIFGATRFDPKSDRWTRITLFQGAPLVDELQHANADDWSFPVVSS